MARPTGHAGAMPARAPDDRAFDALVFDLDGVIVDTGRR